MYVPPCNVILIIKYCLCVCGRNQSFGVLMHLKYSHNTIQTIHKILCDINCNLPSFKIKQNANFTATCHLIHVVLQKNPTIFMAQCLKFYFENMAQQQFLIYLAIGDISMTLISVMILLYLNKKVYVPPI